MHFLNIDLIESILPNSHLHAPDEYHFASIANIPWIHPPGVTRSKVKLVVVIVVKVGDQQDPGYS